MYRTTLLGLNKFVPIPANLLDHTGAQLDVIDVNLRQLCHHLFLDTHGLTVPKPNPIFGLYQGFVTAASELEFVAGTLGTHKEARIAESMKLGKAFCRWFLHDYFSIIHFAHMDHVLGKVAPAPFAPTQVVRIAKLDTPDYLCGDAARSIFLAEAKGRQRETISFNNKRFQAFRDQFTRISVQNPLGQNLKVKGYIVATRFRMNDEPATRRSKLFAEDPSPPWEAEPTVEDLQALNYTVVSDHYASIFEKLAFPLQSASLRTGFLLPEDEKLMVGIWRCAIPQLNDVRFVGGLIPPDTCQDMMWLFDWLPFRWNNDWNPNLLSRAATFFGLEKSVFVAMLSRTRKVPAPQDALPFRIPGSGESMPESVSYLKDGTLMVSRDFMRLEEVVSI